LLKYLKANDYIVTRIPSVFETSPSPIQDRKSNLPS